MHLADMKVAIPAWDNRVSPVLDAAARLLIVDVVDGREHGRAFHRVPCAGDLLALLRQHEVDTVICCAVSRQLEAAARGAGIRVLAHFCGPVDGILQAYLDDRLATPVFRAPGCRHRGTMGRCGRRRRAAREPGHCADRDSRRPVVTERKSKQ